MFETNYIILINRANIAVTFTQQRDIRMKKCTLHDLETCYFQDWGQAITDRFGDDWYSEIEKQCRANKGRMVRIYHRDYGYLTIFDDNDQYWRQERFIPKWARLSTRLRLNPDMHIEDY